jgi:hypothetical protein
MASVNDPTETIGKIIDHIEQIGSGVLACDRRGTNPRIGRLSKEH